MLTILLCFTMASSPVSAQPRPKIMSDRWTVIDNGKRWKQTVWYSDGTRKVFVIEIPRVK